MKKIFFQVLARQWLMSGSAWLGQWATKVLRASGIDRKMLLGNLPLSGIPPLNRRPFNDEIDEIVKPEGPVSARVIYFHGCATNYVFGDVGHDVAAVLARMGVEVHVPKGQSCCGLPIFLSGDRSTSLVCIRSVVEACSRPDIDAVVVDCATCGSALRREYVHILKELKELGEAVEDRLLEQAETLAANTKDITEFIAAHPDWLPSFKDRKEAPVRVTYHDPCHLLKGQGIKDQPRNLLKMIPSVEYVEMEEAGRCCGGGGEYQIEHGETSALITRRKIENIYKTEADVVANFPSLL